MQLSLMTFSMMKDEMLRKATIDTLCQIAKACDVRSLDLMEHEVKMLGGPEKVSATLIAHGVRLGSLIVSPPFYTKPREVEAYIHNMLEMAKTLGTDTLMVVPGGSMGKERRIVAQMTREQALKLAIHHFRNAVEQAKAYGIKVGFENTPQDFKPLASAEDVKKVLDLTPGLGLILDIGNFRVADKNCDERAIYEDLKDYIIRVHVKDVVIVESARFRGEPCVGGGAIRAVMTGSGIIPVADLLARLRAGGYDGDLCIEYAAPDDVSGIGHADVVRLYADAIRGMWEGTWQTAPQDDFPGLNKKVSRLFFGTAIAPMLMGKNVNTLLDAAYAAGINAFDTARGYGMAEKSLGEWIAARNNRERIVVLSKCGNAGLGGKVNVNREVIEKELAKSLKTLGTDYIDIYLLHRDDPKTPVSEIIDTLNEKKREGKIRVFGASNWTHERIAEANAYAEAHGLDGFTAASPNFGLAQQVEDPWGGECVTISGPENADARAWYAANQMPVLAYSSLARGFFSGKFKSGDYEGAKQVLDHAGQKGYLCDENMRRLAVAEELAERDNDTVAGIAMRYIFSTPMNVFALVSSTNPVRMRDNIRSARERLDAADVERLEKP